MLFKTAICDDEQSGIDLVKKYLQTYYFETGIEFELTSYTSPEKLLNDYNQAGRFDMIFLDVEMPGSENVEYGIEIARKIRSIPDNNVIIIFVSNYPEYMNLGYDVHASHYLPKDVPFSRFKTVMDNIIGHVENDKAILIVKTGRDEKQFLRIEDILYIKSFFAEREHIAYCMLNGKCYEERQSILSASDKLKAHGFTFANKYYLINLKHVRALSNGNLILCNEEKVLLSRYYKKDFLTQFSNNILELPD